MMLGRPALLHIFLRFAGHGCLLYTSSWKFLKLKVMIRSVMYIKQLFLWTIIIIITLHLREEE